jgi:hypothetical protein
MGVNYGTYATPRPDLGAAYEEYQDDPEFSQFIADQVAPRCRTPVQKGSYSSITRETALKTADAKRATGAYNRISIGAEDKSFSCEEFGLEGEVDDRKRKFFATDFDLEAATLRQVMRRLKIAQEIRVAALLFSATWTGGGASLYTDVSAAPWDAAASDAIGHVLAAKVKVRQNCGMEPNALILGIAQRDNLLGNTAIKARFPGAAIVTDEMLRANLAAIFGLRKLIVGGAVYNSADEGLTASLADIWGDDYAMVGIVGEKDDPIDRPSVARTFVWTPENAEDLIVEQYREEQVRADILRARHDVDEVVIDSGLGHLLKVDA